jgi:hypothetical protein
MSPEEAALRRVIELLTRSDIPYMLTGSFAASYHGRPRATHDADLVIDPEGGRFDDFLAGVEAAGFYVSPAGARLALQHRRQFNVIDMGTAAKIDLIIRKDREYSREEFSRRRTVTWGAVDMTIISPEDAILSKLEWSKKGDSERQLRDAAGVLELNPGVDRAYIDRWAGVLGVLDEWRALSTPPDGR